MKIIVFVHECVLNIVYSTNKVLPDYQDNFLKVMVADRRFPVPAEDHLIGILKYYFSFEMLLSFCYFFMYKPKALIQYIFVDL